MISNKKDSLSQHYINFLILAVNSQFQLKIKNVVFLLIYPRELHHDYYYVPFYLDCLLSFTPVSTMYWNQRDSSLSFQQFYIIFLILIILI